MLPWGAASDGELVLGKRCWGLLVRMGLVSGHGSDRGAMSDIVMRDSQSEDAAAVWDFLQPFVVQQHVLSRTLEEVTALLKHGFLLETSAGLLVGTAMLEIYSRKLGEIQCLAVAEPYRGAGWGHRLVAACDARARQQGVREVMAITASERLFMDCGFDYSLPGQKRALFLETEHR